MWNIWFCTLLYALYARVGECVYVWKLFVYFTLLKVKVGILWENQGSWGEWSANNLPESRKGGGGMYITIYPESQ